MKEEAKTQTFVGKTKHGKITITLEMEEKDSTLLFFYTGLTKILLVFIGKESRGEKIL